MDVTTTLAKKLLREDEDVRLKPYHDTAQPPRLTIGWGRNLTDRGITMDEAERFLDYDVTTGIAELLHRWTWFAGLGVMRQAALVDLHYNIGLPGLAGFKHFIDAMEHGDYARAADELINSDAARKAKERYARLAAMIRTGAWVSKTP